MIMSRIALYAAGALAAALIGVSLFAWSLVAERDALEQKNKIIDSDRSALNADLVACKNANASWSSVTDRLRAAATACAGEREDLIARGRDAAEQSLTTETKLKTELAEWRARFNAASKTANCAAALEARLCPAVLDY
jgi:hypothetical protein